MALYPAFFHVDESTATPASGVEMARATNGALKLRALWPTDKHSFRLVHVLTPAQRDALQAFYEANKLLDVTYRWPGDSVVRTVRFSGPPVYRPLTWHVEARVPLEEV